jgi:hypothetical protein
LFTPAAGSRGIESSKPQAIEVSCSSVVERIAQPESEPAEVETGYGADQNDELASACVTDHSPLNRFVRPDYYAAECDHNTVADTSDEVGLPDPAPTSPPDEATSTFSVNSLLGDDSTASATEPDLTAVWATDLPETRTGIESCAVNDSDTVIGEAFVGFSEHLSSPDAMEGGPTPNNTDAHALKGQHGEFLTRISPTSSASAGTPSDDCVVVREKGHLEVIATERMAAAGNEDHAFKMPCVSLPLTAGEHGTASTAASFDVGEGASSAVATPEGSSPSRRRRRCRNRRRSARDTVETPSIASDVATGDLTTDGTPNIAAAPETESQRGPPTVAPEVVDRSALDEGNAMRDDVPASPFRMAVEGEALQTQAAGTGTEKRKKKTATRSKRKGAAGKTQLRKKKQRKAKQQKQSDRRKAAAEAAAA